MLEETHVLSRLVEDLRTLALSEAGALPLQIESTDVAALVREVVASLQPEAAEGGVGRAERIERQRRRRHRPDPNSRSPHKSVVQRHPALKPGGVRSA